MGHMPRLIGCITVKTAAYMIINAAAGHFVKAVNGYFTGFGRFSGFVVHSVGESGVKQKKIQQRRHGEFRRLAESTVALVMHGGNGIDPGFQGLRFIISAVSGSENDSFAMTWHQWQEVGVRGFFPKAQAPICIKNGTIVYHHPEL